MPGYDLLIFDLDGVLADTSFCHSRAYDDLWHRIGIQGPPYEAIAGRRTSETIAECTTSKRPSPKQIRAWILFKQAQARQYLFTEEIGFGDTALCLNALSKTPMRLALGTAASRQATNIILDRLDIANFFSLVVTGEDVENGKPAPDIYLQIMTRSNADPERTLIIEDSPSGLAAAIASGASAASVRTGKRVDHPRFIGSFADLRGLLLAMGLKGPWNV